MIRTSGDGVRNPDDTPTCHILPSCPSCSDGGAFLIADRLCMLAPHSLEFVHDGFPRLAIG